MPFYNGFKVCLAMVMVLSFREVTDSSKGELFFSSVEQVEFKVQNLKFDTDFVIGEECRIFLLNRGLMVYFDLYATDFPKSTEKYF